MALERDSAPLTSAQTAILRRQISERAASRPVGDPPSLDLGDKEAQWDFWEVQAPPTGMNLTVKVTQIHLSAGPAIGLQTGWNLGLKSHYTPIKQGLETKRPEIVAMTLDLKFWNVNLENATRRDDPLPSYGGKLVLKEDESLILDNFLETCRVQRNGGRHIFLVLPHGHEIKLR